ncbi:MAG TPA: deoxyribose-phosphate aldolase [Planctomycetes bacterium]|nr:deoxyribose-phosphate aldolase [Planctomycetota bacterium]HIL50820.1 deoxyribose-phosphate aldolase [Planctomycetota bacterium]
MEIAQQLIAGGLQEADLDALGCTSIRIEVCPESVQSVLDAGACRVAVQSANAAQLGTLGATIDHTLLKADATAAAVDTLCAEALQYQFASVCVNGTWVKRCAEILAGSGVMTCTVVGFPLGASAPEVKAYEARRAIEDGACEVDMVINVGALKSGDDDFVRRDIGASAEVCHKTGARLKVILETCLLNDEEKVRACRLAREAGADFVKTSTGFSSGGATLEDIALMRRTVGPGMGIKASGGVRDTEGAEAMLAAGATRIGASASIAIVGGTSTP